MSDHMVNGKPWAQCLGEIRAYKQKSKTRKGGGGKQYGYFTIDEYIQRLDEVIGTDHYEVVNDDFQRVQVANGQDMFVARCTISIIDDMGERIISKSAYGGTEIFYAKEGGRADIGNAPTNACKDAFKHAAELYGILGYHGYKGPSDTNTQPLNEKQEEKKEVLMNLVSEGSFVEAGDRNGKKVWKLASHEKVSQKQIRSDVFELIFYPNQYGKDAKKFNDFYMVVSKKATTFKALVQPCGVKDGKPQYIFKGFAGTK